jgi:tetratricopeptide (TPR) repeat protein/transposase
MLRKPLKAYSEIRIKAVKAYLSSGSRKEVALSFNIHPWTLNRWVNWYKKGGGENLQRGKKYRKPHNRFDVYIEKKIVLLKEENPSITLSDSKKILNSEGVNVSTKGIWGVWKRYGLAGFVKKKSTSSFLDNVPETPETTSGIKDAEKALNKGDIKQVAHIVNALPACSMIPFIEKIPDKFLSLQRQVEKLYVLFGKIPFSKYKNKARKLREQAENKGLFYLSVKVGVLECFALEELQESERLLLFTHQLKKRLINNRGIARGDPNLRFILLILQGHAYGNLFQIKESLNCARKCKILLRSFPNTAEAQYWLSTLFSHIGHHREAAELLEQIVSKQKPEIVSNYASCLSINGEYRTALLTLKQIEIQLKGFTAQASLIRAMCKLGQGKIEEALGCAQLALKESKKEGFRNQYHIATIILASSYAALNERGKAKEFLKRPIPLLKKFRMERDLLVRQTLLGKTSHINCDEKKNITPPIRLALLLKKAQETLKIKNYRKAYNYAQSQRIIGYFHLYLLFLPEPIHHILSKGKPVHLPSRLLKLPVFQKDIPAFHLKFLGPIRIYRNGRSIRAHLSLKMSAFLIHLCLNQRKPIPLISIYRNFWKNSKNPARTFSHFLVRIKKYLKLSLRSLYISKGAFGEEKVLHFTSHITTDYQYYGEILVQAKALERAGEWEFAKREYLRAFALFRGEPFKKMYDNWSEHMRRVILNKLETEALHFAKSCIAHDNEIRQKKRRTPSAKFRGGNMADAKKVLEKVIRIIPDSEEIRNMVTECGSDGEWEKR